jgi:trehalose 6-phosphate synthase
MPGEGQSLAERPKVVDLMQLWGDASERERLILASNRGPVEYTLNGDGLPEARQGAGGVVSGLLCAVRERPVTWIALAMSDADRMAVQAGIEPKPLDAVDLRNVEVRLIDLARDAYCRHYNGISNRVLWFVQHYLLHPTRTSLFSRRTAADWEKGYVAANRAIADAVVEALRTHGQETPVLFQDYHLYLAPGFVREAFPEARLAHFIHIPWPEARYWEMLPEYIVREIYRGLVANDVVGFQTVRDARNFLQGAEQYLPEAQLEWTRSADSGTIIRKGRQTLARSFPIAVTPHEIESCANAPAARHEAASIHRDITRGDENHRLIVRVDRVEPTKNIVSGFRAYELLLKHHPEWHGKVTFLALLVPSRQDLAEYRSCERQVRREIERVNARYGAPGWQPIVSVFENNRARALALMRSYHVLLVNPVIDGMNLVVKEGGLLNEQDGVIVLSRTAGAHERLAKHVLSIHPMDIEQTALALHAALSMAPRQRRRHAHALRTLLHQENAASWLQSQVDALLCLREEISAGEKALALPIAPVRALVDVVGQMAPGVHAASLRPPAGPPPTLVARARQLPTGPGWDDDVPSSLPAAGESEAALSR